MDRRDYLNLAAEAAYALASTNKTQLASIGERYMVVYNGIRYIPCSKHTYSIGFECRGEKLATIHSVSLLGLNGRTIVSAPLEQVERLKGAGKK